MKCCREADFADLFGVDLVVVRGSMLVKSDRAKVRRTPLRAAFAAARALG